MCLVDSDLDIVCITSESCITCMQNKMELIVLQSWNVSQNEVAQLKKNNTKVLRVKCECPNY